MAKSTANGAKNGASAAKQFRAYTVVRVKDTGEMMPIGDIPARRQEEACDLAVGSLPVQERSGMFAAFLASSYREFDYTTHTTPVTTKALKARARKSIVREPTAGAVAS